LSTGQLRKLPCPEPQKKKRLTIEALFSFQNIGAELRLRNLTDSACLKSYSDCPKCPKS
jgi:hypothetical protein